LEHDNPADQYNTVRKMAKKRALVDAVITATNASCIFTQDIEDMEDVSERPAPPQRSAPPPYQQRQDNRPPAPERKMQPTADGIQKFRVRITDVVILKEGTSQAGKKWTLIGIQTTVDGKPMTFTTFDASWADYAKAGLDQLADIEAKPGRKQGDWEVTYIAAVQHVHGTEGNKPTQTAEERGDDGAPDEIPFDDTPKNIYPYSNGRGGRYTHGGD
jgi:hypothetical protein